jgi:hypothetical protein
MQRVFDSEGERRIGTQLLISIFTGSRLQCDRATVYGFQYVLIGVSQNLRRQVGILASPGASTNKAPLEPAGHDKIRFVEAKILSHFP